MKTTPEKNNSLERVILFTRFPEPGKTKTRLIPALGPEGSCALHRQMTEGTVNQLQELFFLRPLSIEIRYDGGSQALMREWLGPDWHFSTQGPDPLGLRLERAFQEAFQTGFQRVVLIGSDCPGLKRPLLEKALDRLAHHDLVLGPAKDGGYYLIGMSRILTPLFNNIPWGTETVCHKTLEIARDLGLTVFLLETLADIDRPEDLGFGEQGRDRQMDPNPGPSLSVIIPALNEAAHISSTLHRIPKSAEVEVIIVDGESDDATRELAVAYGARVFSSPRGRARQMNKGANQAGGEFLLFLHADTHLPDRFSHYVIQTLSLPNVSAGAFRLKLQPLLPGLQLIEHLANWRAQSRQLPYGDQAIFVRADRFQAIGGFAEIPIMEDVDLIRRLRRLGRIAITPVPVITSSRRWQHSGVWRTTLKNQMALAAYWSGISPTRLARWYHKVPMKSAS
jgi:hypothetical protein